MVAADVCCHSFGDLEKIRRFSLSSDVIRQLLTVKISWIFTVIGCHQTGPQMDWTADVC